ncbi:MAG: response regulator [Vallitaleaceae bacterium]|nr:response regulator [Vallitaleaceae bacterium]
MRILIAEDDRISREFLFKVLKRYGECDLTVDGFEALDSYLISIKDNEPYDLLCIDIMMPKFDGLKVLKAIRDIEAQKHIQQGQRAKVILTTALDKSNIAKGTLEFECNAYLSKPIDIDKLLGIMRHMRLI